MLNPKIRNKGRARQPQTIIHFTTGTSAARPAPTQCILPAATSPIETISNAQIAVFEMNPLRFSAGVLRRTLRQYQIPKIKLETINSFVIKLFNQV